MRITGKLVRTYASTILLSLVVAASASAAGANGAANIRIDNFGQVSATYYRGGQPEGRDYVDLAGFGIKTVINLTSDDAAANEPLMVERAGMHYFQIPMTTHTVPTSAQIAQFLGLVNDPQNQPVYVHCVGGKHRTGVMTAVYRMTDEGWNSNQAFSEMKQYGFGADFLHSEFKNFVYGYSAQPVRVAGATSAAAATTTATKVDNKQR